MTANNATAATATTKDVKEVKEQVSAVEKKDDSAQVLSRLIDYMTGGDSSKRFFFGLALRIIGLLGLIALPALTGQALNTVSDPNGTVEELTTWFIYALIAAAIYLGFSFFAERIFADLATKGLFKLQTALFNHMQDLSLSFFDRQPVGQLMSRVSNDTEAVALFYESAVAQIIRARHGHPDPDHPAYLHARLCQDAGKYGRSQRFSRRDHLRPQGHYQQPPAGLGRRRQRCFG